LQQLVCHIPALQPLQQNKASSMAPAMHEDIIIAIAAAAACAASLSSV